MRELIGHADAMKRADPLPSTVLIVGPEGVGKRLAADILVERSGAKSVDVQRCGKLSAEGAREMSRFHGSRPFGKIKVSVADVSVSSPAAVNGILKLLEEPPKTSRIILHSDLMPLLTISSRCTSIPFGLLTDAEVEKVCREHGMGEETAREAAAAAGGSPGVAMRWAAQADAIRAVQAVITALGRVDADALENALMGGMRPREDESMRAIEVRREAIVTMLASAIRESIVGGSRMFGPEERQTLSRVRLPVRLRALRVLGEASRPALRVRSASWVLASGME